jgi:hypothetical protein
MSQFKAYGVSVSKIVQQQPTALAVVGLASAVADALPPTNASGSANVVMPYCTVTRFECAALATKYCTAASGAQTQPPCARNGGAAETSNRHTPTKTIFFRFIFANSSVWNASGAVQRGLEAVESAPANFAPADASMRLRACDHNCPSVLNEASPVGRGHRRAASFVAQRLDGIQTRGFSGRPNSENQSDSHGHGES